MTSPPREVVITGLSKAFGGTQALQNIDLVIRSGEIMGLLGQNGSGKSTLVKVLTGVYVPDSGKVTMWGHEVSMPIVNPSRAGIAVVHQDHGLADDMSIFENIAVGSRFDARALAPFKRSKLRKRYEALIDQLGVSLDLSQMVSELSRADRTLVTIARALDSLGGAGESKLLILDEPTASLPTTESERLRATMRSLADGGVAIVFISHHLGEALSICDTVTVIRDGAIASSGTASELTRGEVVRQMLGRSMSAFYPPKPKAPADAVVVEVDGLYGQMLVDVSFQVHKGEVLGVVGLAGMGQRELAAFMAGVDTPSAGDVRYLDDTGKPTTRSAVGYVPETRSDGVWAEASATENLTLATLPSYWTGTHVSRRKEKAHMYWVCDNFQILPAAPSMQMYAFSGGNQQKVVLAKAAERGTRVLVLDEPTQGVDAGAKHDLLAIVGELAESGVAVVVFSTDFEQVAAICHRVLVLEYGRISQELLGDAINEATILAVCSGEATLSTSAAE